MTGHLPMRASIISDRAQLQEAYTKIDQAADQNRNEAFIYVAVSLGTLAHWYASTFSK